MWLMHSAYNGEKRVRVSTAHHGIVAQLVEQKTFKWKLHRETYGETPR